MSRKAQGSTDKGRFQVAEACLPVGSSSVPEGGYTYEGNQKR